MQNISYVVGYGSIDGLGNNPSESFFNMLNFKDYTKLQIKKLSDNLYNYSDRTTLVNKGISNKSGALKIHYNENQPSLASFVEEVNHLEHIQNNETLEVEVTSIDDFCRENQITEIDFIKIDVEGGELGVLQGAETTLLRHQPLLLFEVNVFCLWRYGRTLPQDLFAWVRQRYAHTAAIDNEGTVTHIEGDATVNHVLHLLGTGSGVIDVIASNDPIGVTTNNLKSDAP